MVEREVVVDEIISYVSKLTNVLSKKDLESNVEQGLFSSGILASIHFAELVCFLEEKFKFEFKTDSEVTIRTMDSISLITNNVIKAINNK